MMVEEEVVIEIESLYTEQQMLALAMAPYLPAFLSLIGSTMILYVILFPKDGSADTTFQNPRNKKECSVYGRILIGLSIMDTCSSLSFIVFGSWTVPIGSHVAYGERGTDITCMVASTNTLFIYGSSVYSTSLAFYCFLAVVWKVKDDTLRERNNCCWLSCCYAFSIEFFFHAIPISLVIAILIYTFTTNLVHPMYVLSGLCGPVAYPPGCNEYDNVDCEEETFGISTIRFTTACMIMIPFLLLMGFMISICYAVFQTERRMRSYGIRRTNCPESLKLTKTAGLRGLSYIGSYFACYLFFLLVIVFPVPATTKSSYIYFPLSLLAKLLLPLQGFFNAMIALSAKRSFNLVADAGKSTWGFLTRQGSNVRLFGRSNDTGDNNDFDDCALQVSLGPVEDGKSCMVFEKEKAITTTTSSKQQSPLFHSYSNADDSNLSSSVQQQRECSLETLDVVVAGDDDDKNKQVQFQMLEFSSSDEVHA